MEKSWSEIESDELVEPPLKLQDFIKSLESTRPTVTEADIKRHDDWTKESGEYHTLVPFSSPGFIYISSQPRERWCMI